MVAVIRLLYPGRSHLTRLGHIPGCSIFHPLHSGQFAVGTIWPHTPEYLPPWLWRQTVSPCFRPPPQACPQDRSVRSPSDICRYHAQGKAWPICRSRCIRRWKSSCLSAGRYCTAGTEGLTGMSGRRYSRFRCFRSPSKRKEDSPSCQ